ncbi:hypothetical protein [Streptomyces guryensis]|uniref:Uncharacterized protein n=1 Tax=Streptomyces guryensis TaxID=2886947 RepID=A0A9Q3VNC6_9ACTN|nr:hypothetical protein [Streptomyces guryensis]MCD9874847.1 hypothetical protein [Streptomyces guryensis]
MTLSKEGTAHEIQFVEQQWSENRHFALLHDITERFSTCPLSTAVDDAGGAQM